MSNAQIDPLDLVEGTILYHIPSSFKYVVLAQFVPEGAFVDVGQLSWRIRNIHDNNDTTVIKYRDLDHYTVRHLTQRIRTRW